jgi:hypothetical protein
MVPDGRAVGDARHSSYILDRPGGHKTLHGEQEALRAEILSLLVQLLPGPCLFLHVCRSEWYPSLHPPFILLLNI